MKDLLIQNDRRLNIVRFFIFFIINLIIVFNFFYPNLSIEQLYTEQYRMTEYIDGIPYYKYENPMIDFVFKYPYNWKLFEHVDHPFLKDIKGIVFEIQNSNSNIKNNERIKDFETFDQDYPSVVNVLWYKTKFKHISMTELAKIKIQDLENLFKYNDFKIAKNEIETIHENIPILKLQYTTEPYFSNELGEDKKMTLYLLIPRGELIYEIGYISSKKEYSKNLEEVNTFINSIRFR